MPPPYPGSEPNPQTQNPLATTPQPATCGTKISLLSLSTRNATPFYSRFMPEMRIAAIQEHPNEGRPSAELSSETGGTSSSGSLKFRKASAPAFGDGNPALEKPSNKNNKKSKPRNSMSKSNSSYISRTITGENLNKRLQDHTPEGLFAFCNINRAFQWLDLSAPDKKDQLSKMLFAKGHCLSHDINMVTKSLNHIDLVLGFSTSDILWIEAISQRYSRINKNGIVNATPCTEVRWIPGSEDLFMAAHMDGSIIVYDKNREDVAFVPDEKTDEALETNQKEAGEQLIIEKSVQSRNQKHNPVSFWKLSNQRINAFAFAPDNRHLAAVSEDGTLKIIDFLKEE